MIRVIVGLLSICLAAAALPPPAGYVSQRSGSWYDETYQQDVDVLYEVREDSRIVCKTGDKRDHLDIRFYANPKHPEPFECPSTGIRGPLDIAGRLRYISPAPKEEAGFAAAFLRASFEVISRNSARYRDYATTMSRSVFLSIITDGIAAKRAGGIDLRNIFQQAPAGTYMLEFCPIDPIGNQHCPKDPEPVSFPWDAQRPALLQAAKLETGLYRLNLCAMEDGAAIRSEQFALVLILTEKQDATARDLFQRARSAVDGWSGPGPSNDAVLRAYLLSLAKK